MYTDASLDGFGAHLLDQQMSGVWSSLERNFHINLLEMEAVRRACLHFRSTIQQRPILLRCDNTTVVSYINRWGGTKSETLARKALEILEFCDCLGVTLMANHILSSLRPFINVTGTLGFVGRLNGIAIPWRQLLTI
jgi:hypothetical protein